MCLKVEVCCHSVWLLSMVQMEGAVGRWGSPDGLPQPHPFLPFHTPGCCPGPDLTFYIWENWQSRAETQSYYTSTKWGRMQGQTLSVPVLRRRTPKAREIKRNSWGPTSKGRVGIQGWWQPSSGSLLGQWVSSFAPPRLAQEGQLTKWLLDGRNYETTTPAPRVFLKGSHKVNRW